jgi:hypothetical protein
MFPTNWRNQSWFDVVKVTIAAFLFATPWIYRFTPNVAASRNAWVCGVVIGIASIWAIVSYAEWQEWLSLLFGLWLLISPWLLGFHASLVQAMRANVTLGIVIVILTLAELWTMHQSPPHVRA